MIVVVPESLHHEVPVHLRDEPAGPAGQAAQSVVGRDQGLQGEERNTVALVQCDRLQARQRVDGEDLGHESVSERLNKLEFEVSQGQGGVQQLVESFAHYQSSPGVEQLQLLQSSEDWLGEVKDRQVGANTGEAEILQSGAQHAQLEDVHLVKLLQIESPQFVAQGPE